MIATHLFAALLATGIFTMWMPQRWGVTWFQLALFAFAAWRVAARRGAISIHPTGAMIAAVAAWGALQAAFGMTVDLQRTLEETVNWVSYAAAFAIACELAAKPAQRERLLNLILGFAAVLAVLAMLTIFSSPPGVILWRWDIGNGAVTLGPFTYRNQYAAFVEAVLPLAIVGALADRRRWVLHAVIAAILFASVVAGGSRAGTILCLAEIVAIPALTWARGLVTGARLARVLGASLLLLATMTAVAGWEFVWNRLQEPNPYSLRADLVRSSLDMVRERPIAGFGLGTWAEAYPGYALYDDGSRVNQAHNDWAQWAVEGGLPLFLLMAALVIRIAPVAIRTVWGVGILFVFAHCLVDYPFQQRPALAAFFFVLVGTLRRNLLGLS